MMITLLVVLIIGIIIIILKYHTISCIKKKIVERITIVLMLQSPFHTSLTHTQNYKERWLL